MCYVVGMVGLGRRPTKTRLGAGRQSLGPIGCAALVVLGALLLYVVAGRLVFSDSTHVDVRPGTFLYSWLFGSSPMARAPVVEPVGRVEYRYSTGDGEGIDASRRVRYRTRATASALRLEFVRFCRSRHAVRVDESETDIECHAEGWHVSSRIRSSGHGLDVTIDEYESDAAPQ
jgi:hypothetical protein